MGAVNRVFSVDPHPVVAAGLQALGSASGEFALVGATGCCEEAPEQIASARADVVLLDPELLGDEGLTLCRRIKMMQPAPRVLFYTAAAQASGFALQARVAGADGMIDKAVAPGDLIAAVRLVASGHSVLPPLDPAELEAAAHRVEPDDLALLAMLADRTPPAEVAETLRMDGRGLARRIERMLPRLRGLRPYPA